MRSRTPDVTAAGFRLLLDRGQAVAIADLASAAHAPAEEAEKALDFSWPVVLRGWTLGDWQEPTCHRELTLMLWPTFASANRRTLCP